MDLVERAGDLKPMLVDFAMSPRFERELSAEIMRNFPDGVVTDEAMFSMVVDQFALQHRLRSGDTVVEAFVAAHPELTEAERDMLLGWRDVVEGMFDVTGKDRDALVLFNLMDELAPLELELPDHLLAAESVAIHFVAGEGLSFYPDYHLLEELFGNPALISRPRYKETLSGFLRDSESLSSALRRAR